MIRALQPALEAGRLRGHRRGPRRPRRSPRVWPGLPRPGATASRSTSARRRSPATSRTSPTAPSSPAHGVMNPQIRFGEDLMSRVSYAMMHPEGAGEMTRAVRTALNGLVAQLAMNGRRHARRRSSSSRSSATRSCTTCCSASTRCRSARRRSRSRRIGAVRAARAGARPARPSGRPRLRPALHRRPRRRRHGRRDPRRGAAPRARSSSCVVDVGTNAEIVLGNRDFLLAASSPTGPAFEGAQISGGQRAAPGAIERVRIDRATLEPRFRVIGVEPLVGRAGLRDAADGDRRHRDLRLAASSR